MSDPTTGVQFTFILLALTVGSAAIVRWLAILTSAIKALAKGEPKEHTRFMVAQNCINQIDDWLEYAYKSQSAEEQRNYIRGLIAEYNERIAKT